MFDLFGFGRGGGGGGGELLGSLLSMLGLFELGPMTQNTPPNGWAKLLTADASQTLDFWRMFGRYLSPFVFPLIERTAANFQGARQGGF